MIKRDESDHVRLSPLASRRLDHHLIVALNDYQEAQPRHQEDKAVTYSPQRCSKLLYEAKHPKAKATIQSMVALFFTG